MNISGAKCLLQVPGSSLNKDHIIRVTFSTCDFAVQAFFSLNPYDYSIYSKFSKSFDIPAGFPFFKLYAGILITMSVIWKWFSSSDL